MYESKTSPQYKAFIGSSRKNMNYTLTNIFLVNQWITWKIILDKNSYLKKYYGYASETLLQHEAFIGGSRKYMYNTRKFIYSERVDQMKDTLDKPFFLHMSNWWFQVLVYDR